MRHLIFALALIAAPVHADSTRYVTAPFGTMVSFTMPNGFQVDHTNAWPGKYAIFALPKGQRIGWQTQLFSLYAYEKQTPSRQFQTTQELATRWIGDYRQDCPGGFRYTPLQVPRMRHKATAIAYFTHCVRDLGRTRNESTLVLFVAGSTRIYALEWLQTGRVRAHMNYARWYPRLALMARNFPVCKRIGTPPYPDCGEK